MTSYTISYRQATTSTGSGQLEEQQETAAGNSGTIVSGLQEDASYLIQVWANTAAGTGERIPIVVVQPPTSPTYNLEAIIGGSVSVLFIVTFTGFAVVVIASIARILKRRLSKTTG